MPTIIWEKDITEEEYKELVDVSKAYLRLLKSEYEGPGGKDLSQGEIPRVEALLKRLGE